jgi:TRAP-type C4-dicarboxylate transport system permease small subunit
MTIVDEQDLGPGHDPGPTAFGLLLRGIRLYYVLLRILITVLMGVIIVPVTIQALSHNFTWVPSLIWTEEIARFCFVWIIMIGAMIAVRDGTHFDVDILPDGMSDRALAVVSLVVHVAIFLVALTFIVYGVDFALLGARQVSELAGLPMLTIYIAWPVAGVTWVLFLVERVAADLKKLSGAPAR